MNNVEPPKLLRPDEAAKTLAISPRTLWGLADLPKVRIGRAVRYDVVDLTAWIDRRKTLETISTK